MNGTRKTKSLKAVRLAEVLYDEHRRLLTLCRSCERHFITFQAFYSHLTDCSGLKHIVTPTDPVSYTYDDAKRETRLVNGRQELHIYDLEAVKNASDSAIDWEAELEDPRWYTDSKPTVQSLSKTKSKENIVKEYLVELTEDPPEQEASSAKRQRCQSTPRRPILTAQQQRRSRTSLPTSQPPTAKAKKDTILVPNVMEDLKRLQGLPAAPNRSRLSADRPSQLPPAASSQKPPQTTSQKPPLTTPHITSPGTPQAKSQKPPPRTFQKPAPPMTPEPVPATTTNITPFSQKPPVDGTQKILNKLRACGVEVKRGSTRLNATPPNELNPTKNQATLDIMRKLQSKGIRCTKVKIP
ncbi:proteoglycan 4 [Drosophila biarmipes]|uniref:proteoglycan 4 n=1 Tax=Drosophila biarmipes TaxID=125945 RepID=UPI0007E6D7D9|nr:proteoglycan 4 [Drosophila biarmipes]